MENLEKQMQEFKQDMHDVKGKVNKILYALMGNELLQDGGLVGSFKLLKATQDALEKRIDDLEQRNTKLEIYQKVVWTCLGFAIAALVGYAFQVIVKK